MRELTLQIVKEYYDSFNKFDMESFFQLLAEDVLHEINQGEGEKGKDRFRSFMTLMEKHYKEEVVDLVIMANDQGSRASAEFFIEGIYLTSAPNLPPADRQRYRLRCGAFFELSQGKITRITNYYNLNDWLSQVK